MTKIAVENADSKEKNVLKKLWEFRYHFNIEFVVFLYIFPKIVISIAMNNLYLEKACLIDLGHSSEVCSKMIIKDTLDIDCDSFGNETTFDIMNSLNYTICKADTNSQKAFSDMNAIRGPIASIVPIIIILFAGSWSDRHQIRKPCLLFALFGDLLGQAGILLSVLFYDTVSIHVTGAMEKIVPSLFGEFTLITVAIYSLILDRITEEDRTFRFGIYATFINVMALAGSSVEGLATKYIGRTNIFSVNVIFSILALLFTIFFVHDVERKPKPKDGQENPAFEFELDETHITRNTPKTPIPNEETKKKSVFADMFDPSLVLQCLGIVTRKRSRNGRMLLILFLLAMLCIAGTAIGEGDNVFFATKIMLGWDGYGIAYSFYITMSTIVSSIGTLFCATILSQTLKLSDSMVGIIASTTTAISRFIFAFARDSWLFYLGGLFDIFISARAVAIGAITATIVEPDEFGSLFAVTALAQPLSGLIFTPLYSTVYKLTVENFTGAFYLFGELFYIPTVFIFVTGYLMLSRNKKTNNEPKENEAVVESTHL